MTLREAQLQAPLSEMPFEPNRTAKTEPLQKITVTLEPSINSRSRAALGPTPTFTTAPELLEARKGWTFCFAPAFYQQLRDHRRH